MNKPATLRSLSPELNAGGRRALSNAKKERSIRKASQYGTLGFALWATIIGPFAVLFAQNPISAQQANRPIESRSIRWLSEIQQAPNDKLDSQPSLSPILQTDDGTPIDNIEEWNIRRETLRKWWLAYLRPLKREGEPPQIQIVKKEVLGDVERSLLSYESGKGWPTQAYLLKPVKVVKPTAAVVVLHSTVAHSIHQPAGVQGNAEKAFGLALAKRGYVTLCPRNFLWPNNDEIQAGQQAKLFHRNNDSTGMAKMLLDAMIAVDILAGLPEVDHTRIGAIGHSLGAKEVLYLAAFDERIKVGISSEGGIGASFSNWDAPWYLGQQFQQVSGKHEHHELLGLIAPRQFLLIGGNSADGDQSWPFISAALPVYKLYSDEPGFGLFNHNQGHAVPREAEDRIYEWMQTYLPPSR